VDTTYWLFELVLGQYLSFVDGGPAQPAYFNTVHLLLTVLVAVRESCFVAIEQPLRPGETYMTNKRIAAMARIPQMIRQGVTFFYILMVIPTFRVVNRYFQVFLSYKSAILTFDPLVKPGKTHRNGP
jgi:hypothetical protein